mmetsp:Transcript_96813/g.277999  ORF Transcript_96813/g.277999 Transcript_96813/m.277999 type:complete len:201 (+) Transcript_96813:40-642(+)
MRFGRGLLHDSVLPLHLQPQSSTLCFVPLVPRNNKLLHSDIARDLECAQAPIHLRHVRFHLLHIYGAFAIELVHLRLTEALHPAHVVLHRGPPVAGVLVLEQPVGEFRGGNCRRLSPLLASRQLLINDTLPFAELRDVLPEVRVRRQIPGKPLDFRFERAAEVLEGQPVKGLQASISDLHVIDFCVDLLHWVLRLLIATG